MDSGHFLDSSGDAAGAEVGWENAYNKDAQSCAYYLLPIVMRRRCLLSYPIPMLQDGILEIAAQSGYVLVSIAYRLSPIAARGLERSSPDYVFPC